MNRREKNLLCELLGVVVDALDGDGEPDLVARVRAWLDVAEGRVTPSTPCAAGVTERGLRVMACAVSDASSKPGHLRRLTAVRLATEGGSVTSGELAAVCNTASETARRDLCAMARDGLLVAKGTKRGRKYTLAAQNADTHRDQEGSEQ